MTLKLESFGHHGQPLDVQKKKKTFVPFLFFIISLKDLEEGQTAFAATDNS